MARRDAGIVGGTRIGNRAVEMHTGGQSCRSLGLLQIQGIFEMVDPSLGNCFAPQTEHTDPLKGVHMSGIVHSCR
jgi:hypothetical protein